MRREQWLVALVAGKREQAPHAASHRRAGLRQPRGVVLGKRAAIDRLGADDHHMIRFGEQSTFVVAALGRHALAPRSGGRSNAPELEGIVAAHAP
jgi:hypothetical protein